MGALCGWIGPDQDERPPAVGLRAMADAYRGRRQNEASIIGRQGSIWAAADRSSGVVREAGEILTGIVGQPRWRDPALVEEQRQRGHAAALSRAYREHGIGLLGKISGPFAFAILDQSTGEALLAIDRMGIHSLYFSSPRGGLVFGSNADLVRSHPVVRTSIPLQAIYDYLHAYVCRSPGTIYAEQRKLGPGHFLRWKNGEARVEPYWQMPFEPDRSKSEGELAEELVEQVRRAVQRSLPDGRSEGVGAFLSGGLDSSTVTGMLSEMSAVPTKTFTIGFDESSYDEMRFADAANRKFRTEAHRYYLKPGDVVAMASQIAAYDDEPFGNSSAISMYLLCRRGSKGRSIVSACRRRWRRSSGRQFSILGSAEIHPVFQRVSAAADYSRIDDLGSDPAPYTVVAEGEPVHWIVPVSRCPSDWKHTTFGKSTAWLRCSSRKPCVSWTWRRRGARCGSRMKARPHRTRCSA